MKLKGIEGKPVFSWWVSFTLNKRDRIIASANARLHKKTYTYGVELPRFVENAYRLDKQNGNSYWRDAIKKETKNVLTEFEILEIGENPLQHLKELGVHLIFNVKM